MPYIDKERRKRLDPHIDALRHELRELGREEGDVVYCLFGIVLAILPRTKRPRFKHYNRALGALSSTALELYRDRVGKYEDAAKVRNGPLRW